MKKITLTSVIVLSFIAITGCKKEKSENPASNSAEVPTKQVPLLLFHSATWCGYCGESMKPAKDSIIASKDPNVAIISAQGPSPDPLSTPFADSLRTWQFGGHPAYTFLGSQDYYVAAHASEARYYEMKSEISKIQSQSASGGVLLDWKIEGNKIVINTKSRLFKSLGNVADKNNLRLNCFILENNISSYQSTDKSMRKNMHDCVLRASASSSTFGPTLTGSPEMNKDYEKSFSVNLNPQWKNENLKVVAVLTMEYYYKFSKLYNRVYINAMMK